MSKGRVFDDEQFRYVDSYSGREVVQLTHYLGHSNHLYFTDPCWIRGDRSMVFTSDRANQSNLFRYDLDTGTVTQLTDLEGDGRPGGCFSKANNCHYFWWQSVLYELDIETLEERAVCEIPANMLIDHRANPTSDGKYICSRMMEMIPQAKPAISFSYSRFREFFRAKPLSQIIRVEVATGDVEVIHEERCYLGHVNTSPTQPELLTYCHEGPWNEVDQRIWGLNILTGETWKIRPQTEGEAVGHEYWFKDGVHIGYHGRPRTGKKGEHIFGWTKWDNSEHTEASFPYRSWHFHSLDESIIVGDGSAAFEPENRPFIQLFKWDGERYVGPRILAYHRSTFNNQHAHCHPRFTPDGKYVLYTSDLTAYSNMYLVEVGDFESLPELE